MNNYQPTFFIEGIGSVIDRDHTAAGWVLAAARAGELWLAVTIEGDVPHKDSLRSVIDRTDVAVN